MPIYTYRCENCGHKFDRRQNFRDNPLKQCPECHKHALLKVYKPARIMFKGSGFYATDNRSGTRGPAGTNGKSETKEDKQGDSEKSETKKETSSDKKTETKASESKTSAKENPSSKD